MLVNTYKRYIYNKYIYRERVKIYALGEYKKLPGPFLEVNAIDDESTIDCVIPQIQWYGN